MREKAIGDKIRERERERIGPRLYRSLEDTICNLTFSLNVTENHWRVLSKVMTRSDFCFNRVFLAYVLRIDYREARTEVGNPVKWLL